MGICGSEQSGSCTGRVIFGAMGICGSKQSAPHAGGVAAKVVRSRRRPAGPGHCPIGTCVRLDVVRPVPPGRRRLAFPKAARRSKTT